jgi:UDPglucose 6-dehydrogenase
MEVAKKLPSDIMHQSKRIEGSKMKISIIGTGVVGQATGIGFHKYGHDIVFHDIDQRRLEILAKQGYKVAKSLKAISSFDVHMICINTPLRNNKFDLLPLESAITELTKVLTRQNRYQLLVIRSTILPLTTRTRIIPLLQRQCPMNLGKDYGLCYNPEFLRQAHALEEFLNPSIVVIGESDQYAGDRLAELYKPFNSPQVRTSLENAEAIKCFSNAYNSMKISFFNLLFLVAQQSKLDHEVIEQALIKASLGISLPSYYTSGGRPFYGACLPKDLVATVTFVKEQGVDPKLLEAVAEINETMKKLTFNPTQSG